MKKLLQFLFVAVIMAMCGMTASAQSKDDAKKPTPEQFATRQAQYIAKKLSLDEANTQKYVDTYCQFQKEVWALGSPKDLSAKQSLDYSQKVLDLRKKYYDIYAKFLTEDQLNKAYRLEKRMMNRMGKHKAFKNKDDKNKGPKNKDFKGKKSKGPKNKDAKSDKK